MERKEQIVATNTRYPRDLHDALLRLAREHRRSFNAEVMWALQEYIQQEESRKERMHPPQTPRGNEAT